MSVKKRGKKYVVRYYDADGKYRLKTFDRERDAKAWEAQVRVDLKKGIHRPDRASATIKEAGALWLERCEAENLEPDAIRQYEQHLRMHIYPATVASNVPNGWKGPLGDLKLSRLTTPSCDVFALHVMQTNARTSKGKVIDDRVISRRTASHVVSSFKMMLNDAQKRGLITYNPALPIRVKLKKREQASIQIGNQIPDRADVCAILRAATGHWRTLFMTDSFTGMRASELRALAWPNVHLERSAIDVCNRADTKCKIGACKSKSAYRTIQIGDDLVEELRRWKEICPASPLGLVFPSDDGSVLSSGRISVELQAVQRRIGLIRPNGKAKYHVHSLRHFFVSILIAAGTLPKRLQELLGHSTLAMTMDTYGHLFPPTEDETARINKAIASRDGVGLDRPGSSGRSGLCGGPCDFAESAG